MPRRISPKSVFLTGLRAAHRLPKNAFSSMKSRPRIIIIRRTKEKTMSTLYLWCVLPVSSSAAVTSLRYRYNYSAVDRPITPQDLANVIIAGSTGARKRTPKPRRETHSITRIKQNDIAFDKTSSINYANKPGG